MLKHGTREAILEHSGKGHSRRSIAKALGVSRGAIRRVIAAGTSDVPPLVRAEKAEAFRGEILGLLADCRGNLVRVHEELVAHGADISYQGLTAFCRRHGIGGKPKEPAGSYEFGPGMEMQHDTSPHKVTIGGKLLTAVQTASLVLCYSRMLFFQFYPSFRRFECKVFLTEAFRYMRGVCRVCMIDNTHVVVLRGTGTGMVPVPEMEAFAKRLGFEFRAHEVGHADRSAHVERGFRFIENNFLAGRKFADWSDANRQARDWCDRVNGTYKTRLRAKPQELFASERVHLQALPIHLPDPVEILHRVVDVERYVSADRNRYSVPPSLIGRTVEAHQSQNQIRIYHAGRLVATHDRVIDPVGIKILLPEHRVPRHGQSRTSRERHPEEQTLLTLIPEIATYLGGMKKQGRLQSTLALRRLLRMAREYPREPLLRALALASNYGLYDMEGLESLILRHIAQDYFLLSHEQNGDTPREP